MVYFHAKNPNLGFFGRNLKWKMLVFLSSFGIFHGHLEYLMADSCIFPRFGMLENLSTLHYSPNLRLRVF
jgi:hypothetical protein